MDPDQARHFVGPDLGANCFQRLSADDKTVVGKALIRPGSILKSMRKTFVVATITVFFQDPSMRGSRNFFHGGPGPTSRKQSGQRFF